MDKIIHYINADYTDGDWGGVARFDYELRKVFPEMITCTKVRDDVKNYVYDKSRDDYIYITDNGMVNDLPYNAKKIVVHHGCASTHQQRDPEWGGHYYVSSQNYMSRNNTWFIAPSKFCRSEFKKHHGIKNKSVILHSVDTVPNFERKKHKIVLGDWRDNNKGKAIVDELKTFSDFEFRQIKCDKYNKAEAYKEGGIYLSLSLSEGNSYSMMDAIACNIPILGTNVGIMDSDVDKRVGFKINWELRDDPKLVQKYIDYTYDRYDKYKPREWMDEKIPFELWKSKWKNIVEEISNA